MPITVPPTSGLDLTQTTPTNPQTRDATWTDIPRRDRIRFARRMYEYPGGPGPIAQVTLSWEFFGGTTVEGIIINATGDRVFGSAGQPGQWDVRRNGQDLIPVQSTQLRNDQEIFLNLPDQAFSSGDIAIVSALVPVIVGQTGALVAATDPVP